MDLEGINNHEPFHSNFNSNRNGVSNVSRKLLVTRTDEISSLRELTLTNVATSEMKRGSK